MESESHMSAIAHRPFPTPALDATPVVARALTRRHGTGPEVLRGVSLEVAAGELVVVTGAAGAGKTTLVRLLAGLERPTSGDAWVGGVQLSTLRDRELTRLRRTHVGLVLGAANLLPMLTVEENVLLPVMVAGRKPDRDWVAEVLHDVGLSERYSDRPCELSAADQQRVAIARAVVSRPAILLADEPAAAVDAGAGVELLGLLRECVDRYGQSTVICTRDEQAAGIADRAFALVGGRLHPA